MPIPYQAAILAVLSALMLAGHADAGKLTSEDLHIRDPYILAVPSEKQYYLYGTTRALRDSTGGPYFDTFVSKDLKTWEGPVPIFSGSPDFWGTRDYWAPEVHRYRGKYYLFATLAADRVLRATQVFVSDSPRGPFQPLTDRPVTPFGWQCLDGTLFVDSDGKPWIVFCHEWEQTHNGGICAMRLTEDLKYPAGKPVLLFRGSEAPWIVPVPWAPGEPGARNYITDGPCLYRTRSGQLLMLWSSFGKSGYVQGVARSKSGRITGPWEQEPKLLFDKDGGHGMIFKTFDGKLMYTVHAPNGGGQERPRFLPIREVDDGLVIE